MNEIILPVKDAARKLGISVWTLRKTAYEGEVASVKIGAKLLIPESEMERLVREGMRPRRMGGRIGEARTRITALVSAVPTESLPTIRHGEVEGEPFDR